MTGVSSGASTFWTMASASTTALSLSTAEMERSQVSTMERGSSRAERPAYLSAMPGQVHDPSGRDALGDLVPEAPGQKALEHLGSGPARKDPAPTRLKTFPPSWTLAARKPLRA